MVDEKPKKKKKKKNGISRNAFHTPPSSHAGVRVWSEVGILRAPLRFNPIKAESATLKDTPIDRRSRARRTSYLQHTAPDFFIVATSPPRPGS